MTREKVTEFLHAQPFRPFVVHLADGRAIPVHHPDFVASVPSGRLLVILQPDESMNVVDLFLVTDLELRPNGEAQHHSS